MCAVLPQVSAQVLHEGVGIDSIPVIGMSKKEVIKHFGKAYTSKVEVERVCYDCPSPSKPRVRTKKDPRIMIYPALGMKLHLEKRRVVTAFFEGHTAVTSKGITIGATRQQVEQAYGPQRFPTPAYSYTDEGITFFFDQEAVWGIQLFLK